MLLVVGTPTPWYPLRSLFRCIGKLSPTDLAERTPKIVLVHDLLRTPPSTAASTQQVGTKEYRDAHHKKYFPQT